MDMSLQKAMFAELYVDLGRPDWAAHLKPDNKIVHCPDFENAIAKIIDGKQLDLTDGEALLVRPFLKVSSLAAEPEATTIDDASSYGQILMNKLKRKRQIAVSGLEVSEYKSVNWVPTQTNTAERLFSKAKHFLTEIRQAMHPITLEALIYLKVNRSWWDLETVTTVIQSPTSNETGQLAVDSVAAEEDGLV